MEHESFWTLFFNLAHWEFEIFLLCLFDGVIGAILWPFVIKPRIQRWKVHHRGDDTAIEKLQRKVDELERRMNG
jgi:hypothetical protein